MVPTREEWQRCLEIRHTKAVQDKLSAARVAVCGLGGLGSAIAAALARVGIGRLHLIDFDRVELSNLNRQQYSLSQLGKPKPLAMKEEIARFAPYIQVDTDFVRLTEENIPVLLSKDEYICEAFDDPQEKAMLILPLFQNKSKERKKA